MLASSLGSGVLISHTVDPINSIWDSSEPTSGQSRGGKSLVLAPTAFLPAPLTPSTRLCRASLKLHGGKFDLLRHSRCLSDQFQPVRFTGNFNLLVPFPHCYTFSMPWLGQEWLCLRLQHSREKGLLSSWPKDTTCCVRHVSLTSVILKHSGPVT